jgi:hypothetical protein
MIARFRRIHDIVPYALTFQPLWPSYLLDNLVSPSHHSLRHRLIVCFRSRSLVSLAANHSTKLPTRPLHTLRTVSSLWRMLPRSKAPVSSTWCPLTSFRCVNQLTLYQCMLIPSSALPHEVAPLCPRVRCPIEAKPRCQHSHASQDPRHRHITLAVPPRSSRGDQWTECPPERDREPLFW